jgi:hypothetical protein
LPRVAFEGSPSSPQLALDQLGQGQTVIQGSGISRKRSRA